MSNVREQVEAAIGKIEADALEAMKDYDEVEESEFLIDYARCVVDSGELPPAIAFNVKHHFGIA